MILKKKQTAFLRAKGKALLQIMRIGLVGTALSNMISALLLSQGTEILFPLWKKSLLSCLVFSLPYICITLSLYPAGMVLNDIVDYHKDQKWFPHRPLPSGQLTLKAAWILGIALLITGSGASFFLPWKSQNYFWLTLLCILLYSFLLKQKVLLGSLSMAGCRFFHYAIPFGALAFPCWLVLFYTFWITLISYTEKEWWKYKQKVLFLFPLFLSALGGYAFFATHPKAFFMAIIAFIIFLSPFLFGIWKADSGEKIGENIAGLIQGFIFLDMAILAGKFGSLWVIFWLLWLLPWLGRIVRRILAMERRS
ncbi:MAG: hypothetical protein D6785_12825 [Planctomycetota bacterium]|nr:MAG: hypothetical protein D6785_12825 [Planctomycetota bacterium]